jgi:hypothetical protein
MVVLQSVAVIAGALLGYSIAWEAVRYVRLDHPTSSPAVRLALSVLAFVATAAVWPLVLVAFVIKFRTAWPVTGGKLVPARAM